MTHYQLLQGDCVDVMRTLPANSVHCVVTSPPYFGLRDYQVSGQIGLEETPEQYVAKLVDVFREVRRLLRDDGTVWLNLGDSYSSGRVANLVDALHTSLKECLVFGFDALPVAQSGERVNVPSLDQGLEYLKLLGFLSTKRIVGENRDNDFAEVFDFLATPRHGFGCLSESAMVNDVTATDVTQEVIERGGIIVSDLDSDLQPELAILLTSCAGASKHNDATLAIEKAAEPGTKIRIRWHPDWDSFSLATRSKSTPNVNPVNDSVSFGNCLLPLACNFGDFRITKASEQQVTFTSKGGAVSLTVFGVSHLFFSFSNGSVLPYSQLYRNAIAMSNAAQSKNECLIPFRLARALQEDGWICRQTIIWHKPNPMPESVRDRCTKAHEYVFLLTKSARYWYDAEAVKEEGAGVTGGGFSKATAEAQLNHGAMRLKRPADNGTRNRRSVWTIATQSYSGAHFATFPPKLVEPMILAGCPAQTCPTCGKGWERVVEKDRQPDPTRNTGRSAVGCDDRNDADEPRMITAVTTLGFRPSCDCGNSDSLPGVVLDPFNGSGTTGEVAMLNGRNYIGVELNPEYIELARIRLDAAETSARNTAGEFVRTAKEKAAGQLALFAE